MATVKKFEDLEVWQLARKLNTRIYPILLLLNESRNFELKNQLDGSAGSVMDNIPEGFEREGNKEFIQALYISKGSLAETKSQLYRTFDRGIVNEEELNSILEDCVILGAKIAAFISYLKNSEIKGNKYKGRK
jgi:four helix bundle protein